MSCKEQHPQTGDTCVKGFDHSGDVNDPRTRQHETERGLKWPTLHQLDPAEGYNGSMPYRF